MRRSLSLPLPIACLMLAACSGGSSDTTNNAAAPGNTVEPRAENGRKFLSRPLVSEIYTADPSAHVWDGKIYVYPSHDVDAGIPDDDLGSQYAMHDYRILSMDWIGGAVTVGPVALDIKDVPWAGQQMWAPDAARKDGSYFLYFPVKDKRGVFHIGVATGTSPTGPFKADPEPIPDSFSMDPNVFADTDGEHYMYFGGIWGGQLQKWATGKYDPSIGESDLKADDKPALTAKVAKMAPDMKHYAEKPRDVVILDEKGKPILGGDHARRFFEGSWMYKRAGKYYFTYSTGDTHFLAYAVGDNPYGPFTFKGHFLKPVQGWTTHHSIVDWDGKAWLFYHDTQLSGKNHLRNVKVTELRFDPDGSIRPIDPFVD